MGQMFFKLTEPQTSKAVRHRLLQPELLAMGGDFQQHTDPRSHRSASPARCSWTGAVGNLVVSVNLLRSSDLEIRRMDYAAESYPWHVVLIGCSKS